MIDIKQIIQEASVDAMHRNVKFIKNLLNKSEFEKYFQQTFDISDGHKITAISAQEIFDYVSKRDITDKLGLGLITQRE